MPSSRAIVLSKEAFGEADCYIQFLTKDWGVISTLAKSARKSRRRYIGGLDIFCHDEISIRGNPFERPYLNELKVLNPFLALRDKIERLLVAGRMVQWIRRLIQTGTPVPELYSLLGQTLSLLQTEQDPARMELLELLFKVKLLNQLGLKPRAGSCDAGPRCAAKDVYFNLESGGVQCSHCSPGKPLSRAFFLSPQARQFLAQGDRLKLTEWNEVELPNRHTMHLNRMVTQFASFHNNVFLPD